MYLPHHLLLLYLIPGHKKTNKTIKTKQTKIMKKLLPALFIFCSCNKELIKEKPINYASLRIDLTNIRDSVLSTSYEYFASDRSYNFSMLDGDKHAERSVNENVTIKNKQGELSSEGRPLPTNTDTIQLNTYGYRGWDYKLVINAAGFNGEEVRLIDKVTRLSYDITSYSPTHSKRFALAFNVTSPQESSENRFIITIKNTK